MGQLTVPQRTYVQARCAGNNIKTSANLAGCGERYGYELERNPKIVAVMRAINKQAFKSLALTREDVLAGFMDAVNSAASSTELTAAWREIGRVIGAYEPEVVVVKTDPTPEQLRMMSERELVQLAGEDAFDLPALIDAEDAEFEELLVEDDEHGAYGGMGSQGDGSPDLIEDETDDREE